jgi:hypothetical protein
MATSMTILALVLGIGGLFLVLLSGSIGIGEFGTLFGALGLISGISLALLGLLFRSSTLTVYTPSDSFTFKSGNPELRTLSSNIR